jgi:two-component system chemotaxis response regulator CheB
VQVIGIVLGGGGGDGATGLRTIKKHGGTALVPHPENAPMAFMPRVAVAAGHPDACLPVQRIVRFVGSFCSRYQPLPSDFHHWFAAQEVP